MLKSSSTFDYFLFSDTRYIMSSSDYDSDTTMSSKDSSETEDSSSSSSMDVDSSDDEVDERESLLPTAFKDREPKLEISEFGLQRLRKFFLGQPIPREEKKALTVYCTLFIFICLINVPFFRTSIIVARRFSRCSSLRGLGTLPWHS